MNKERILIFICFILSGVITYCLSVFITDNGGKVDVADYIALNTLILLILLFILITILEYYDTK